MLAEYKPATTKTHAGREIAETSVFFAPPPKEIGRIKTAHTTLSRNEKPALFPPLVSSIFSFFLCGFVISLLAHLLLDLPLGLRQGSLYGFAAFFSALLWLLARRYYLGIPCHRCTYVGEEGVAELLLLNHRKGIVKQKMLKFSDAESLFYHGSRCYANDYRYTRFKYGWKNLSGKRLFQICGAYHAVQGAPKDLDSRYYFGLAADNAWSDYRLPALVKSLKKKGGVVTFKAGSVNIDLSRDGLHATTWGRRILCDEISSVVFEGGNVTLHNLKYRGMGCWARFLAGAWLKRDVKITVPYTALPNGKIFMQLLCKSFRGRLDQ